MSITRIAVILFVVCIGVGCSWSSEENSRSVEQQYTFGEGPAGWTGAFVDYPVDADTSAQGMNLTFGWRSLPDDGEGGHGLLLSGRNQHDDLFMFVKRKLGGLQSNASYDVTFTIELASNAPIGCVGIGGAPGESVYLKAGAAPTEPKRVVEDGWYRLNVDKGNQSSGGERAPVLGTIDNGVNQCTGPVPYRRIERSNEQNPVQVTTNSEGAVWLFAGTDSGFEGTTRLYYNAITVTLRRR